VNKDRKVLGLPRANYDKSRYVLFMVRHENDLDFMLPLMLCACNPIVCVWGPIEIDDFRVRILERFSIYPKFLAGTHNSLFSKVLMKLLSLIPGSLYQRFSSRVEFRNRNKLVGSFRDFIGRLEADSVCNVVFDHSVNDVVEKMIGELRKWKQPSTEIFALPHSQGVVSNQMTKYSLLKPPAQPNWGVFDKIYSFAEHQSNLFVDVPEDKKAVISSLRCTREWGEVLGEELLYEQKSPASMEPKSSKIRVLLIHNRLESNINEKELNRMVKTLDQFGCFDIRVKPHPRRISDLISLTKVSPNLSVISEHIFECVRWADCVVLLHSSAVYDAMLLDKPILHCQHIDSNQVDSTVRRHCIEIHTPDEFYNAAKCLAEGKKLRLPDYSPPVWVDLVDKWADVLNN
jgi:hypothetical protein